MKRDTLLVVLVFHLFVGGACISFPFPFPFPFRRLRWLFGGEGRESSKAPSPAEQKIARLESDLHEVSIEYDIMRQQLYRVKQLHSEQRLMMQSMKRDAEKTKRKHEEKVHTLQDTFEVEKEILVRNMQMMFEKDMETEREHFKQEIEEKIAAEKRYMLDVMGKQTREADGKHRAEVTELKSIIHDLKSKLNEKTRECESATMEINKLKEQLRAGVLVLQNNDKGPERVNGRGSSGAGRKVGTKAKPTSSSAASRLPSSSKQSRGGGSGNRGGRN